MAGKTPQPKPPGSSPNKTSKPKGYVVSDDDVAVLGIKPENRLHPKQVEAISRPEQEICFGGARGGGKSVAGIYFLIRGNLHEKSCAWNRRGPDGKWMKCNCAFPDFNPDGSPNLVNRSYIYHPNYLGCVLRRNAKDLLDWTREARGIYARIGGEFKVGENRFDFPKYRANGDPISGTVGAQIFCGHYEEEDAFMKYQGQNIIRFVIEEAAQIPDFTSRLKLLKSSCRSVYKEMKAQVFLTCNPGGASHSDILDRYIEPKDEKGNIIPQGTSIMEEFDSAEIFERLGIRKPAEIGDKIQSTRVFIFSSIKDNPSMVTNADYLANLMDLDEEKREAYLFGNWHVLSGEMFRSFRPSGPRRGEPPEANHVVPYIIAKSRIQPWWWRTMAMDWGFGHECATLWGAHDQDTGQLWITNELLVSQTEPDVIGEEIGRRTKPMLEGLEQPMITMGLSHDAYGLRQDDRSIAELIAKGIGRILGPDMVHVPDLAVSQLKRQMENSGQSASTKEADEMFAEIRKRQGMGITIRRMRDERVVGWQFLQSLMRWKSTLPDFGEIFDANLASDIAYEKGVAAYGAYVKLFQQKREILPKLQIVGGDKDFPGIGCPRLIAAIPKMIRDEKNPEDGTKKHIHGVSDVMDCARYLAMTFKNQSFPEPFAAKVQRRVAEVRATNPNVTTQDLIFLNRKMEREQKGKSGRVFSVIRTGRSVRALTKGLIGRPS